MTFSINFAGHFLVNGRIALTRYDRQQHSDQIDVLFGEPSNRIGYSRIVESATDSRQYRLHSSHGRACVNGKSMNTTRRFQTDLYTNFQIKEVAPTKHHQQFWKHDIKLARSFNQTHDIAEDEFTQKLADEMNQMQQTEDYTARLLRNINRKSYQNTWSPSGRNSRMVHTNSRDRRPSLTDLENMYAHLSATPSKSERLRAIPRYGSNAKKTFTSKSLSPAPYRTLNDAKSMPRKSKGRHALAVPVRMRASDANHMQNISEHNQTASSTFETVPNASACHSDDNASAKSANTVTSVNSNSVRSIRRFTVTPTIEPF